MNISVQTTGQAGVIKTIEGLEHFVDAALMARLGSFAEFIIKQRTAQGRDVNGKLFKPYSEKYKLFRQEAGRGQIPNLFFSGRMLGALTHRTEGSDTVRLFFHDAQQAAKASGNQRHREFFGLSADDITLLMKDLETELAGKANA